MGAFCCTYEEPRMVRIHRCTLSLVHKLIYLGVAIFISVYFIWCKHGYQDEVSVESAVTTKLFGVEDTNTSDHTIWDNADYMIPPKENGAFTVFTSVLVTPNQIQNTCDEDPSVEEGRCKEDSDCPKGRPIQYGNGVMTGRCVSSTHATGVSVCEIRAWCPVEIDDPAKRSYLSSETFTVFIKNNVRFHDFNKVRQNIPDDMGSEELSSCLFDPRHPRNKHCPVFKVNTIVEETGHSFDSIVEEGAVIEIVINWKCNFDCPEECLPTYRFYRLDRKEHEASRGFHLRFADFYVNSEGKTVRTLYRAYGIRVIVTVQGVGRKFGWFVSFKTIGSGLSYFAFASLVVSNVMVYFYRSWLRKEGSCKDACSCKICGHQVCYPLCSCLQSVWKRCRKCYRPLQDSERTPLEGAEDDLRTVNFFFLDKGGSGCCKRSPESNSGANETSVTCTPEEIVPHVPGTESAGIELTNEAYTA